jgi:hypothetical protein
LLSGLCHQRRGGPGITDRSIRTLILAIFTWVVELERESVSERTKEGLAKARNEGKQIGHPFREINWKTVDECREKGISWSTISRILDIPYSTLIRARNRRFRETYLELGGERPKVEQQVPSHNAVYMGVAAMVLRMKRCKDRHLGYDFK